MDSVEQHLRSDVSTVLSTAKYSQETCSQARVRLHSKAITLDTSGLQGAFASDSLVFNIQVPSERLLKRRTLLERDVSTSRQRNPQKPSTACHTLPQHLSPKPLNITQPSMRLTCWLPIRSLHG